jgi:hypothetical protein
LHFFHKKNQLGPLDELYRRFDDGFESVPSYTIFKAIPATVLKLVPCLERNYFLNQISREFVFLFENGFIG